MPRDTCGSDVGPAHLAGPCPPADVLGGVRVAASDPPAAGRLFGMAWRATDSLAVRNCGWPWTNHSRLPTPRGRLYDLGRRDSRCPMPSDELPGVSGVIRPTQILSLWPHASGAQSRACRAWRPARLATAADSDTTTITRPHRRDRAGQAQANVDDPQSWTRSRPCNDSTPTGRIPRPRRRCPAGQTRPPPDAPTRRRKAECGAPISLKRINLNAARAAGPRGRCSSNYSDPDVSARVDRLTCTTTTSGTMPHVPRSTPLFSRAHGGVIRPILSWLAIRSPTFTDDDRPDCPASR